MTVNAATGGLGTWNPVADSEWGVFAIRTTPTRVLVGGDFTHVSGIHRTTHSSRDTPLSPSET